MSSNCPKSPDKDVLPEDTNDVKHVLKSKTFWFGLAVAILPFAEQAIHDPIVSNYPYLLTVIGGIVIILRLVSATAVAMK